MNNRDYCVYVYIDPRNLEEFYYGKRKGLRPKTPPKTRSDSEQAQRIRALEFEGLQPIIRTVAAGLTEAEALLIRSTLMWKLGRSLTCQSAGRRYASLFRSHNTLHREVAGFDF